MGPSGFQPSIVNSCNEPLDTLLPQSGGTGSFVVGPKSFHDQFMVDTIVLGIPVYLAVLKDPPLSADKDVIVLLSHNTNITIPYPAILAGALIPKVRNP